MIKVENKNITIISHLTCFEYDQDTTSVKIKNLITAQSVIELTVLETE